MKYKDVATTSTSKAEVVAEFSSSIGPADYEPLGHLVVRFDLKTPCPFADPNNVPLVAFVKSMRSKPKNAADFTDFLLTVDVEMTDIDGKQVYGLFVTMTAYNLQIEKIVIGVVASINVDKFVFVQ